MKAYFENFARYNQWANETLYSAMTELPDQELKQDLKGFFGSPLGTLNHILVGDLIWMRRIDHQDPQLDRLDLQLHDGLNDLAAARRDADARLIRLTENLTPDDLNATLVYRNVAGEDCADALVGILAHIFNHQTHHRGQCHHMLSQLGRTPPPLDMIYYLRAQSS